MSVNCLFCKIVKGDIPAKRVFENESVLGFVDIHPQAKLHYLFIHKNHTANINEMSSNEQDIGAIFKAITTFTIDTKMDQEGFRIVTNLGPHAGQTVFHTHFHLIGGEPLGHFGS